MRMEIGGAREILEIRDGSVENLLRQCDASWFYEGKNNEPHALLTSGKHSDGYINLNAVLQFPNLGEILAEQMKYKLMDVWPIDAVVSSSFAAITFGQELARQIGAIFVFTEKEGQEQKWSGRFELPKGAKILQVEELITTLITTRKVKEAVLTSNPEVEFVEVGGKTLVVTIVHRPEKFPIPDDDYEVVSLIPKEIHNWEPDKCPLCKKGSPVLKPKPNWQRFIEHR